MKEFISAHGWGVSLYAFLINLLAFILMGIDKDRAKRGAWRVPERVLFLAAVFGGSAGAVAGMRAFRHKTKRWYFRLGMPFILALQLFLTVCIAFFL